MSIRTATMSTSYVHTTRHSGFIRKLVVLVLFVVGIAGSMALFQVYQKNLSSFWMTVLAIMSIGLACGSASRIIFYQWSGLIRFSVILFSAPMGLFILGVFTNWQMGIGPLNPWVKGTIPHDELMQLGGAFLIALICLEAWWKAPSKIIDVTDVQHLPRNQDQLPAMVSIEPVQPRISSIHTQESSAYLPKRNSRLKFMKASKTRGHTNNASDSLILAHTAQPTRSRRKRVLNRKPVLQLSVFEEHRCPYCLDDVKRNDPRGVKECEVCHSLHHADCWAITGMCQVPHLNT